LAGISRLLDAKELRVAARFFASVSTLEDCAVWLRDKGSDFRVNTLILCCGFPCLTNRVSHETLYNFLGEHRLYSLPRIAY
jgi:hypothetical protein